MIRLRFPKPEPIEPPATLPAALRWDAPPVTLVGAWNRREFLKAAGLLLATLAVPLRGAGRAYASARGRFFTVHEFATLHALCERILPADDAPGASALGAPRYIARLLSAFDHRRPHIFAGGPFSRRNPFPNPSTGTASVHRPHNAFRAFTRLTRLQGLYWRAEVFGSATVPELSALDAQFGAPKIGLRDVYRSGLAKTDQVARAMFGADFIRLNAADQDAVFVALDNGAFAPDPRRNGYTFIDVLIEHTLEGCFAAPEYGGNCRVLGRPQGWAMIGLEGDSQPLGYSIFSTAMDDYVERPDHPMSTPNPDELGPGGTIVPKPLTADGAEIQQKIIQLSSGFSSGLC
jgi:hypothetical protein